MTCEEAGLTPELFQYYEMGRIARRAGHQSTACNINGINWRRGAWMSGFWDQDFELRESDQTSTDW
jgi:hypothetical protein